MSYLQKYNPEQSNKFIVTREQKWGRGFVFLPQAFFRIFLTCPSCGHKYLLIHDFCKLCLEPRDALVSRRCSACFDNGQEPSSTVEEGIADCPKCAKKCRDITDIHDPEVAFPRLRHARRRKLPKTEIKKIERQSCEVCDFEWGLEFHHKDRNKDNNKPDNLQVLCKYCHVQAGKLGETEFNELISRVREDAGLKSSLYKSAEKFFNRLPDKGKYKGKQLRLV